MHIVCISETCLRSRLLTLCALSPCRLSDLRLSQLVIRQPSLLSYFPSKLASNLRSLCVVLGLPLSRGASLVVRQPCLAMLSAETFAAKFAALEALLGCGRYRLSIMVRGSGRVLAVYMCMASQ